MASTITSTVCVPEARRWSLAEFYQLGELGWFQGQAAELIEGEILVMSPQGSLHYLCLERVAAALTRAFGPGYFVRRQAPLELDGETDPEPDVAVVRGQLDDQRQHPTTAVLVVEIASSSLDHDRGRKARLYAQAGIQEYWIVNLIDLRLEVLRQPGTATTDPTEYRYAQPLTFLPSDSVTPLGQPGAVVAVADLLPPQ